MTISIISSKKTQNGRFPRVGRYFILEMIIPHRALAFDMLHFFAFHALVEFMITWFLRFFQSTVSPSLLS